MHISSLMKKATSIVYMYPQVYYLIREEAEKARNQLIQEKETTKKQRYNDFGKLKTRTMNVKINSKNKTIMESEKRALMKLFSLMLKNRAKEGKPYKQISPDLLKFFTRKELIEIINHIYDGVIPEEYKLVDMENRELLNIIDDDFSIISYVTNKWSKEALTAPIEVIPLGNKKIEESEKGSENTSENNQPPKAPVEKEKK